MSALELQATAQANAQGTATITFGPVPTFTTWTIRSTSVASTSSARTACTLFRNTVAEHNQLDVAPYSGNGDTTDTVLELHQGESLVVQWTGADPGATCSVNARGTQEGA